MTEKVLLVDDEPDALEVLEWVLSDYGFSVRTASSGEQAIEIAASFRPDLLITDHCLRGELSGIDVIRSVRRDASVAMRAVLMTGLPPEQFRNEIKESDEITIVSKPFRWSDLRAELELCPPASGVLKTAPGATQDRDAR